MPAINEPQTKDWAFQTELLGRHWADATRSFVEFPRAALERSIAERFEHVAYLYPDRTAVKSHDATLSYGALNRQANRLARAVNSRLGDENEPVALLFERGAIAIVAIFAILKAGKFYVALDPTDPDERLTSFLTDSQSRLIVTNRRNLELAERLERTVLPSHPLQIILVEEVQPNTPDDNLALAISPESYAAIIYTSGSTGQPKGAIHNQRSILHFALMLINHYRICPQDRQGQFFSYSYSGVTSSVFAMLLNGGMLLPIELETLGLGNLADWIVQNEITILHLTPQFHRQFFASLPERNRMRFPRLRILAVGGGLITSQDVSGWLSHLSPDCVVSHSLASTEAFAFARFFVDSNTPLPFDTLPVGYPEPDKEILLLGESGRWVSPGEVGEIVVRSHYLSPGYWRKPELTAAVFESDTNGSDQRLFFTGDLGRLRPDGMLEMAGRKDFQVKIRGFTIQPSEVEIALYDLGIIHETVVVAVPSGDGNSRLVAYVAMKTKPAPTVTELRSRLKEKLPESSLPSAFVFLDALPHTPNGKIDRAALPKPGSSRPPLAQPYLAARDPMQAELVQLWERALEIDGIGIQDDFFDLGGDSLVAEMLLLEIEARFDKLCSASIFLEAPTIQKLAAVLSTPDHASGRSVIIAIQPEGSKPPLFLAHGFTGSLLHYASLARHLGPEQPVYGIQPAEADGLDSRNFQDTISHYVDELLDFRPSGPHLIGGFSYGAAIAYEIACQMEERGRPVAFLAIFDFTVAARYHRIKLGPEFVFGFIKNLPYWLAGFSRLDPAIKKATAERWTRRLKSALQSPHNALDIVTTPNSEDMAQVLAAPQPMQLEKILREWAMVRGHAFKPYSGNLTLFRAQAHPFLSSFDPVMNWKDMVRGNVSLEIVPGTHADFLHDRNIPLLAAKLKRCLDQVQATG